MKYFDDAIVVFHKSGGEFEYIAKNNKGLALQSLGHTAKALKIFIQLIDLNKNILPGIIFNIGHILLKSGAVHKSLKLFEKALKLAKEYEDIETQASAQWHIGLAKLQLGQLEAAAEGCIEALKLFNENGDRIQEAGVLNTIGEIHAAQGEREKASEAYSQALDLLKNTPDPEIEAKIWLNQGDLAAAKNELGEMKKAYEQALKAVKKIREGEDELRATVYFKLGLALLDTDKRDKARELFEEWHKLDQEMKTQSLQRENVLLTWLDEQPPTDIE